MSHDPLPERLKPVRDMLMQSADGLENEPVPAPPPDLLDDLEKILSTEIPASSVPRAREPWSVRLTRFLTSPGFAIGATAVIVAILAAPLLRTEKQETFRDPTVESAAAVPVILLGADDATWSSISENSPFDPAALYRVTTEAEAGAIAPPKIVVDFPGSSIRAYDGQGELAAQDELPADDLAGAIVRMLAGLD